MLILRLIQGAGQITTTENRAVRSLERHLAVSEHSGVRHVNFVAVVVEVSGILPGDSSPRSPGSPPGSWRPRPSLTIGGS